MGTGGVTKCFSVGIRQILARIDGTLDPAPLSYFQKFVQ